MPNPIVSHEPDFREALTWWSELPAKWTPFGWKDHLFRFNVLYNGAILAIPNLNPRSREWETCGCQLGVVPLERADFPGHVADPQDNGMVIQGWEDHPAPVLWSEWSADGILFRETVFAHVPGGKAVETGIEPLFAWIRFSVHDTIPGLPLPEKYGFNLNINAPYFQGGAMSIRYNLAVIRENSKYFRTLTPEKGGYDIERGLRVYESTGKVRIGIAPGHEGTVEIHPGKPTHRDFLIHLGMKLEKGCFVDVLLPMVPVDKEIFDRELALGYDLALTEANSFWSEIPETAARFETPETCINKVINQQVKFTEIIAETDPATGRHALLTGSWIYADIWATPAAMQCVMLLDAFGYHNLSEKYLRMYVESQGTVLPVGEYYKPHPGSLGPPEGVAACVWTSDHGALLWALSEHALIAGSTPFAKTLTEPILKACDFIRYMRSIDEHKGFPGLIPPGVATDMPTKIQSVWADAWNYKGLHTAVRYLKAITHPKASEFEAEAADYRRVFRDALQKVTATMPVWTDDHGREHRLVPMALHGAQPFEYRNAFYLDTGPLVLVFAGLVDADEETMRSTIQWFREGPPARHYRYDSDCWQVPALHREVSSCEPVYSFNVYHSHQLGDRRYFIEALYGLFSAMYSRQTYTACETRGGVTGCIGGTLAVDLARLAVVDDRIEEGSLHLLRLCPSAWLRQDRESLFENMPTYFGPVSLRVSLNETGNRLQVFFQSRFRKTPDRIVLHIPPVPEIHSVEVNGKAMETDGEVRQILL